jgi:hypothetical protein
LLSLAACAASNAPRLEPGAEGFDLGGLAGWNIGSTGGAGPHAEWGVRADAAAVSAPNVLVMGATRPASEDRFNVIWNPSLVFRDGHIAVHVRADGGEVDQGGGPMWRVQDADNYYVCRFNPLESNYRVYVVERGVRRQLATALVDAPAGAWHRIEVEHVGAKITCWLDGRKLLVTSDATLSGSGGVGLWTKADARTAFDELLVRGAAR